jgi:hypothetical protein
MVRMAVTSAITPAAGTGQTYDRMGVYGDHGLTLLPVAGDLPGVAASDVIKWSAALKAPLLDTSGVQSTTFPIPHLAVSGDRG